MAFAILRIQKITANKVGGANAHNTRTMEVPNSDNELQGYNSQLKGTDNLKNDIDNRLKDAGIDKTRSNAVLGIEHMMTASPEFFNYKKNENGKLTGNVEAWQKFEKECMNWLKDQYGDKNIINAHVHKDEKTPHIHAIVTPILEKEISWKNGNEKGSKTENRLSARDFINGADKLQKMQDSFANHLQKSGLDLDRGQKGSKARHTEIKEFYSHIQKANDFKTQKTEINIQTPKIQIEKPSRFANLDEYKTNTEQEIQKQVNSIQEDTHKSILEALKPLQSTNTLLLEESRLKTKLDSENQQLRRMLFNANQENQKLKEENQKLKNNIDVTINQRDNTFLNKCITQNNLLFVLKNPITEQKKQLLIDNLQKKISKDKSLFEKLNNEKIKKEEAKKQAEKPKNKEKASLKEKVTTGEKKEESKKSVQKYTSIKKSKSKDRGMSM